MAEQNISNNSELKEKLINLVENLSDSNVQRILIYTQGLMAGTKMSDKQGE